MLDYRVVLLFLPYLASGFATPAFSYPILADFCGANRLDS